MADSECPSPEDLAVHAEGVASPESRDAITGHLAACADCRREMRGLLSVLPGGSPRGAVRRWRGWAAAAAVLLALGLNLLARRGGREAPFHDVPSGSSREVGPGLDLAPGTILKAGPRPRGWALASSARLAMAGEGAAVVEAEGVLGLGTPTTLWVDNGSCRAVSSISTPRGRVELGEEGSCVVRWIPPHSPASGAFLREARAGEEIGADVLSVACLSGRLTWQGTQGACEVVAGHLLEVTGGKLSAPRALTPDLRADLLGWRDSLYHEEARSYAGAGFRSLPVRGQAACTEGGMRISGSGKAGHLLLPGLQGRDYAVRLQLKPLGRTGEVGLAFPVDGVHPYWVLPLARMGETACLEARRQGDRIRFCLDGVEVASVSTEQARRIEPRSGEAGLSVWGGAVEVTTLSLGRWTPEERP